MKELWREIKKLFINCLPIFMIVAIGGGMLLGIIIISEISIERDHRREIELIEAKHKYQQIQIDTTNKENNE